MTNSVATETCIDYATVSQLFTNWGRLNPNFNLETKVMVSGLCIYKNY